MSGAIVFDLDGTLIDSAPDLHAAANRMLADCDKPPLTLEKITSFIGNGIPNLVRLVMEERGIPSAEEERMRELMLAHYTAHPADLTRPYAGVVDVLTALKAAGHPLGVCTNKFRAPSIQILDALDLTRFFDVVIGGDSLQVKKPDPAPLVATFEALNAAPFLYVGDSEVDAETAHRAKIAFGLFSKGYRKTPVEDLPNTFVFDEFKALIGHIRDLPRP
ncbi:phosphoglycolate phosphatase [Maritalea mobilis]|uniref:phosphoglycolate phosphatase n=1 Tax=Maritalea mobilis TaxID=483324 RepID=UPI001C95BD64|nr:phosphoglycolate phosphatase [Maritalea mobilis]MBY6203242.1 phosphoglycolate phosphatase [Maritalea mobilis]